MQEDSSRAAAASRHPTPSTPSARSCASAGSRRTGRSRLSPRRWASVLDLDSSLISEIQRGLRAPSLEVATKLALALGIPAEPLLDWAHTRRSPRSVEQVRAERSRYRSEELPRLEESMRTAPSLWDERRMALTGPLAEWGPGSAGSVAGLTPESPDDVPGGNGPATDPDGRAARPVAYIPRRHLPTSLAEALVRPVAFVVSDEDFDCLRRPAYVTQRPRYAVVTRPPIHTIDPREPYAVRRRGQVEPAYVAWDGRELLILPPPGKGRFDSASAEGPRGLERRLVGQVVAMLGWV